MAFHIHFLLLLLSISAIFLHITTAVFICPSGCSCDQSTPNQLAINVTGSRFRFPSNQHYPNITVLRVFTQSAAVDFDYLCQFPDLEELFVSFARSDLNAGNFSGDCVQYLRVLHVQSTYLTSFERLEPFRKLTSLQDLHLVGNTMRLLNDTELGEWNTLHTLDISHNALQATCLPPLLFVNSTRISHVSMPNNGIEQLPSEILAPLFSLASLNLADNVISDLGFLATAPDTIKAINIRNNRIKELTGFTFRHMIELQSLDLGYNDLTRLDSPLTACCTPQLQFLYLDHNNISSIAPHVFGNLDTLVSLNLSNNGLQTLHTEMFASSNESLCNGNINCKTQSDDGRPWHHFQSLDVSFNHITHVAMDLLSHKLALVEFLDISHNKLHNLPRLEQLPRLQTVNFSHNRLSWLDVGVFNNPKLSIIDLSHNQITKIISMAFLYLPALTNLDLSHNEINYIYKMAFYRTCKHGQAMSIDLSMNSLHNDVLLKLVDCFKHLQDTACTVAINLQHNAISRLLQQPSVSMHLLLQQNKDARFFNTWDHVRFFVQNNRFSCDCKLVSDINVFEQMHSRYGETFLHPVFLNFWRNATCSSPSKLRGIGVADFYSKMHNRCHEEYICPKACDCLPHSTYTFINCSYRNLKQPPVLLLPGPKILQLQGNQFRELDDLQFQQVQSINLSGCNIHHITSRAWSTLMEIPSVALQNNFLSTIPVETACASELNILNNPVDCSCSNADMLSWLHSCNATLKEFDQMNCSNGTAVLESSYNTCVQSKRHLTAGYVTLLSLCITVLVGVLVVGVMYQHRSIIGNYLMGAKKWHKVQAEEYDEYDIVVILSQSDADFVKTEILTILQKYNSKCLQLREWKSEPGDFTNIVQSCSMCMLVTSGNFLDDLESEVGYRGCIHNLLDQSVPTVCLVSVDGTTLPYKYPPHQQISFNTDDFKDKLLGVVERSVPA